MRYTAPMARKTSTLSAMRRATGALVSNWFTALAMAGIMGIIVGVAHKQIVHNILGSESLIGAGGGISSQKDALVLMGALLGWGLLVEVVLGPALAASAVYVGRTHTHGARASLYKSINFTVNRYKRMFKWHAAAWLSIQIGLIAVIVPGLMFLQIYAFVDPILCLEKEQWPLARSKKLSRGRRKTILLLCIPWILVANLVQGMELFGFIYKLQTTTDFIMVNTLFYLVVFWTLMCFYMVYEDRTEGTAKKKGSAKGSLRELRAIMKKGSPTTAPSTS